MITETANTSWWRTGTQELMRDPSDVAAHKLAKRILDPRTRAATLEPMSDVAAITKTSAGWALLAQTLAEVIAGSKHEETLRKASELLYRFEVRYFAPVIPSLLQSCEAKLSLPTQRTQSFYCNVAAGLLHGFVSGRGFGPVLDACLQTPVSMQVYERLLATVDHPDANRPFLQELVGMVAAARAGERAGTLASSQPTGTAPRRPKL